jgi:hypothetical protein
VSLAGRLARAARARRRRAAAAPPPRRRLPLVTVTSAYTDPVPLSRPPLLSPLPSSSHVPLFRPTLPPHSPVRPLLGLWGRSLAAHRVPVLEGTRHIRFVEVKNYFGSKPPAPAPDPVPVPPGTPGGGGGGGGGGGKSSGWRALKSVVQWCVRRARLGGDGRLL